MAFGNQAFTAEEIAHIQAALDQQLSVHDVSWRPGPGGQVVSYLTQAEVLKQADKIFGPNGWSSSITQITTDFIEQDPASGLYSCSCSAIVRVTLKDGCYRENVGTGFTEGHQTKQAALEFAKKKAVTDGLKRALKLFGNSLGNGLGDKLFVESLKPGNPKFLAAQAHAEQYLQSVAAMIEANQEDEQFDTYTYEGN